MVVQAAPMTVISDKTPLVPLPSSVRLLTYLNKQFLGTLQIAAVIHLQ